MSPVEFSPPLVAEAVIGQNTSPEGKIESISLLLRDANKKLFTLHVATDANYLAVASEAGDDGDDALEPVFVVPGTSIGEELIPGIVEGIAPEVLSLYLVAQNE